MDSNTHSTSHPTGTPTGLAALVAELQGLAAQDPDRLADAALAERVRPLRGLVDRLEGHWLAESWPTWTPGGPPGPSRASRPAPPLGGCAVGST